MPPQAYALVTLFALSSVALGWFAVRIVNRVLRAALSVWAYALPIGGAFFALYLVGHRLGVSVGPEVSLFGFRVAILGDLAIGFVAALAVAVVQALALRVVATRRQPSAGR